MSDPGFILKILVFFLGLGVLFLMIHYYLRLKQRELKNSFKFFIYAYLLFLLSKAFSVLAVQIASSSLDFLSDLSFLSAMICILLAFKEISHEKSKQLKTSKGGKRR